MYGLNMPGSSRTLRGKIGAARLIQCCLHRYPRIPPCTSPMVLLGAVDNDLGEQGINSTYLSTYLNARQSTNTGCQSSHYVQPQ